jgi:hypothetical protein
MLTDPSATISTGGWTAELRRRWATLHRHLLKVRTGPLANAALAGVVVALVLASVLAHLNLNTFVALLWTCVSMVLFIVAGYDLVVRWSSIDLDRPTEPMSPVQRWFAFMLRSVWPEIILVLGVITGHYFWP